MFLEVVGWLVMVGASFWYSLLCIAMVGFGGLDLSPFWSKYYTQGSGHRWNRYVAVGMTTICAFAWYWVYRLSPFILEIK